MIIGLGVPKFTGTGDPNSSTVSLTHSVLEASYNESVLKTFQSVLNKERTYADPGAHASFKVIINLFKYAAPKTTAATLYSYLFKDVIFYPYSDGATLSDGNGKAIQNSSSVNIRCRIINIEYATLDPISNQDIAVITLQTNSLHDFSKLIQS